MNDLDAFLQAIAKPGVPTVWISIEQVTDWLLAHPGMTIDRIKEAAPLHGLHAEHARRMKGRKVCFYLKFERIELCQQTMSNRPHSEIGTELFKSEIG